MKQKPRLIVRETVYHQPPDANPVDMESRFSLWCTTDEMPFVSSFGVSEEAKALSSGWLSAGASQLCISSPAPRWERNPTDEQRAAEEAKIVELSYGDGEPFALLRRGHSLRFEPTDVDKLKLRCRSGLMHVLVTLMPR